ncbi:DUF3889 domain-containing protein [Paenibacillus sp. J2TS4]|uniref:DUF3889 domain-containing protein n=1 Tax=Paenibacillus sp. J2TS4 TaxID=2807194 RepID=UPI001B246668|nr:DUF3889 domain-containing protein [Paenibacillus sp. J2TS4]GIP31477.1 hypothetical protein J2TS4_06870 [Paenibacillus sp. J2TS4]
MKIYRIAVAIILSMITPVHLEASAASKRFDIHLQERQGSFHSFKLVTPEYAKWGNLAMREASKKGYQILDYQYIGKQQINPFVTEQKFKFWVSKQARNFGLYVSIRFESTTERVLNIDYEETDR